MKSIKRLFAMGLAVMMALSIPFSVSAAELEDAPIDESRTGSLTIYKYDLTNAEKDGVWDSSYVSTGVFDQTGVNDVLGGSGAALGNGETGYGYAIKGVEFSYIQVADIVQFSESENDSRNDSHVEVLYAIDKTKGADFLKALNLADGAQRYTNADALDSTKYYYQSDVLIDALAAALESNSTVVKNALEAYISANGGAAMSLTDSYGKTQATNLNLGLYLVVETKVPEMVVSTTDPFLVSVPMTSVNGTNATDGGTRWIYDITRPGSPAHVQLKLYKGGIRKLQQQIIQRMLGIVCRTAELGGVVVYNARQSELPKMLAHLGHLLCTALAVVHGDQMIQGTDVGKLRAEFLGKSAVFIVPQAVERNDTNAKIIDKLVEIRLAQSTGVGTHGFDSIKADLCQSLNGIQDALLGRLQNGINLGINLIFHIASSCFHCIASACPYRVR